MRWTGAAKALFGRWGWVGVTVALLYPYDLVYMHVLTPFAGAPVPGDAPPVLLFSVLSVVGAWRAGGIPQLDARSRRAWRLFGTGLALMMVSNLVTDVMPHTIAFPSPGHYGRFAAALILLGALHWFPLQSGDRPERLKLGVDAAIVLAAGIMIIWYFVIGPHVHGSDSPGTVLAGAFYPVVDLILVFAAVRLQLRAAKPSTRGAARLLTAALMLLLFSDTLDSYQQAMEPGQARGTPITHTLILTVFALLSVFPREQRYLAGNQAVELSRRRTAGISHLPLTAVKLSCALMSIATVRDQGLTRLSGLILAGTAVTLLVLLRQQITQQENHALATTDALTGVANRARIDEVLARTLEVAARNGRHTAVLLADLNGFKAVNDTLGHKAGDALLIEFAALLRRSVLGADFVGRLGGDEFVIILHGDHDTEHVQAVERRITEAMAEPMLIAGTMVQPSASLGAAVGGPGELGAGDLLHRADMAMYNQKRGRRSTAEADPRRA